MKTCVFLILFIGTSANCEPATTLVDRRVDNFYQVLAFGQSRVAVLKYQNWDDDSADHKACDFGNVRSAFGSLPSEEPRALSLTLWEFRHGHDKAEVVTQPTKEIVIFSTRQPDAPCPEKELIKAGLEKALAAMVGLTRSRSRTTLHSFKSGLDHYSDFAYPECKTTKRCYRTSFTPNQSREVSITLNVNTSGVFGEMMNGETIENEYTVLVKSKDRAETQRFSTGKNAIPNGFQLQRIDLLESNQAQFCFLSFVATSPFGVIGENPVIWKFGPIK